MSKHIKAAKEECKILEKVKRKIPDGPFARFYEAFSYKENLVMMFEPLGMNLFSLLEVNKFKGFPLAVIRKWAKTIFKGLRDLHDEGMIHTDLKVGLMIARERRSREPEFVQDAYQRD